MISKKTIILVLLIIFISTFWAGAVPVSAQAALPNGGESYSGEPLCMPGAYLQDPEDCVPFGPSQFLTEMAQQGIFYPLRPLPAAPPDPALNELSLRFAKINAEASEPMAVYASIQDASSSSNPTRYIPSGMLRFVSYTQTVDVDSKHFVQLRSGEWMRASPAGISVFQGLLFKSPPQTFFGWIVEASNPRSGPGYQYPLTSRNLYRNDVVQIYQVQEITGTEWYMIGLNEWVERRYIRQATVNNTPPEGVNTDRWIELNLYEQTMMVYENRQLVFATLMASGVEPYYTKPGLFQIYEKKPTETMTGAFAADKSDFYYLEDVPWTMYYDQARALHGAYWRTMFGYPQSHGCVNLSLGDAHWLYNWANEGDWVYVWDPSGQTPTDPALYNEGGA
ncbi:MAG: L,D-transpeptidase [Anaerolineaceae bacterium]|nr:L,D-transpeptidase [Anaerolineaceae bacterium]